MADSNILDVYKLIKRNIIGVYKITNPNGAIYIGSSIDIKRRIGQYKSLKKTTRQVKLYNSFGKYGFENHNIEIICTCIKDDLHSIERYYGIKYNSIYKTNLNCVLPKSNTMPIVISKETRMKISESRMGNKHWNYGRKMSEETRNRISNSHKGKKLSDDHKLKLSVNSKSNKIVIDLNTGFFYDSVSDLSRYIDKYSPNYIRSMLNGNRINKTQYKYA